MGFFLCVDSLSNLQNFSPCTVYFNCIHFNHSGILKLVNSFLCNWFLQSVIHVTHAKVWILQARYLKSLKRLPWDWDPVQIQEKYVLFPGSLKMFSRSIWEIDELKVDKIQRRLPTFQGHFCSINEKIVIMCHEFIKLNLCLTIKRKKI